MYEVEKVERLWIDSHRLDEIATEVYGRKYNGLQSTEDISNDTSLTYDMDEDWVDELVEGESYVPKPEHARYSRKCLNLSDWLAVPDSDEFSARLDHERSGPEMHTMLAHLIKDGHLPYGTYLLNISW